MTILRSCVGRPSVGICMQFNTYKCGDKLPKPHWVTFHKIPGAPAFHCPQYFQPMTF